jgi:hypothetical protein
VALPTRAAAPSWSRPSRSPETPLQGAAEFTIHDTIVVGGAGQNCGIISPPSSESYNLEDDSADTCGFKLANHDLVGSNPQFPSELADDGGPTQTLAPATTSPVLGAGGQCLDPTSTPANQPLVAIKGFAIPAGETITLRSGLIASSVKLLKQFRRLPVRLTLTPSTASGTETVASPTLTLHPQRVKRHKRPR